jgi:hypothetical protein
MIIIRSIYFVETGYCLSIEQHNNVAQRRGVRKANVSIGTTF